MYVGPKTILVGHSLDSDLRAFHMVHHYVIDTAIVVPHAQGMPSKVPIACP
jgi:RNA exonuclease 1